MKSPLSPLYLGTHFGVRTSPYCGEVSAFDLSDGDIADLADRCVARIRSLLEVFRQLTVSATVIRERLVSFCERQSVAVPQLADLNAWINRLSDPGWWRRALRKRRRSVEQLAIQSGQVHRWASPYVSAKALNRHLAGLKRNADWIDSQDALNISTGETIPLRDIYDRSLAAPRNRRMAMMARIKGIEADARSRDFVALFLTITAPSRMHAYRSDGHPNPTHDGSTPREVQAYLNSVWRRARRSLQHQNIEHFGLRTVEPHHDACPHWHVLVFAAPGNVEQLLSTLHAYALEDSPDEAGAAKHRFGFELIDPSKGSAAGYVAKYVSKGIDGEGVGTDDESLTKGDSAAIGIVAWARLWGIRQFQFFGVPPITPVRELYRVPDGAVFPDEGLMAAHRACRSNDYGTFLAACRIQGVGLALTYEARASLRYPGEQVRGLTGLSIWTPRTNGSVDIATREETWCLRPRRLIEPVSGFAFPWTRFNNCAPNASGDDRRRRC